MFLAHEGLLGANAINDDVTRSLVLYVRIQVRIPLLYSFVEETAYSIAVFGVRIQSTPFKWDKVNRDPSSNRDKICC
jgi:hypothetical protein